MLEAADAGTRPSRACRAVCFASAISSFTLLTGRSGLTTSTFGPDASIAIGVNDLIGS